MSLKIALLPGDGIGPEVTDEAVRILKNVAEHSGKTFTFSTHPIGGVGDRRRGRAACPSARSKRASVPMPCCSAPSAIRSSTARLPAERPEAALLALRQALGGFANLRPAICYAPLAKRTPFQPERVRGANLLIVRELLGGLYFGEPRGFEASGNTAFNTLIYSRHEIERVAKVAFERARERRKKVASIDKANVLETSRLWRAVVSEVATSYPDVELEHVLRRYRGDAPGDVADELRRDALRQPVRRHPERPGGVDRGIARRAAVGDARRPRRSVRAGPWLGAGHRRQGRSPIRSAPSPARRCCCASARRWTRRRRRSITRSRTRSTAGARTKDLAAPGERALSTREMGQAIEDALHDIRDRRHSYHAV